MTKFKTRKVADASTKMYGLARDQQIVRGNAVKDLSNQLDGQIKQLTRRDQFTDRNRQHELNDFIGATTHWKEGREALVDNAEKLGTSLIKTAGAKIMKDRQADAVANAKKWAFDWKIGQLKEVNTHFMRENAITNTPITFSPADESESSKAANDFKDSALNSGVSDPTSNQKPLTDIKEEDIKELINTKNLQALTDAEKSVTDISFGTSALAIFPANEGMAWWHAMNKGDYSKIERRAIIQEMVGDTKIHLLNLLDTHTGSFPYKNANGEVEQIPYSEVNGRADKPGRVDDNPYIRNAALTHLVDTELLPAIERAGVGNGWIKLNVLGTVNQQLGELQYSLTTAWTQQNVQSKYKTLNQNLFLDLSTLEANKGDDRISNLHSQKLLTRIIAAQNLAAVLNRVGVPGYENPKLQGIKILQQGVIAAAKKNLAAGNGETGFDEAQNLKIPWEFVRTLVPKSFADEDGNVFLRDAYPKLWSESFWDKKETEILKEKVDIETDLRNEQKRNAVANYENLRINGGSPEAIAESKQDILTRFGPWLTEQEIANLNSKLNYHSRPGIQGWRHAIAKIDVNNEEGAGKISDLDLQSYDDLTIQRLRERYGWVSEDEPGRWHYGEDGVLEKTNLFDQVSSQAKQKYKLDGINILDNNAHILTKQKQAQVDNYLNGFTLHEKLREVQGRNEYKGASADEIYKVAVKELNETIPLALDNEKSIWYRGLDNEFPNFYKMRGGADDIETHRQGEMHRTQSIDQLNRHLEKGYIGNPHIDPQHTFDFGAASNNRYLLNQSGHIDTFWYDVAALPSNTAVIPVIGENGEHTGEFRKATPHEIRAAYYEKNKHLDSMQGIALNEEHGAQHTIEDLIKRIGTRQYNHLVGQIDNPNAQDNALSNADGGPIAGTTRRAVRGIINVSGWNPLISEQKAIKQISRQWENNLIRARGFVEQTGISKDGGVIEKIALALYHNLDIQEINPTTQLPVAFDNPRIRKWVKEVKGLELN